MSRFAHKARFCRWARMGAEPGAVACGPYMVVLVHVMVVVEVVGVLHRRRPPPRVVHFFAESVSQRRLAADRLSSGSDRSQRGGSRGQVKLKTRAAPAGRGNRGEASGVGRARSQRVPLAQSGQLQRGPCSRARERGAVLQGFQESGP